MIGLGKEREKERTLAAMRALAWTQTSSERQSHTVCAWMERQTGTEGEGGEGEGVDRDGIEICVCSRGASAACWVGAEISLSANAVIN